MKDLQRPPRYLPQVLKAISHLREPGGSNTAKIVNHVKTSLKNIDSTPGNLSMHVRRALKHATINGIVRQRAGKFRFNSAIFNPFKDCNECRRRRRKREKTDKKRRRRRRRHAIMPSALKMSEIGSDSETIKFDSDSENEFPVRELRRRRRRKKDDKPRRRRRRRSGRRHAEGGEENQNLQERREGVI